MRFEGVVWLRHIDKLVEFFERNDTSEYWDQMPEVHFDIDIKKRTAS